jgi:ribonucleoside-triphosphate reductase
VAIDVKKKVVEMEEKEVQAQCKSCGSNNVYGMTRVVGYFSKIENWNGSKKAELKDRQKGDYKV